MSETPELRTLEPVDFRGNESWSRYKIEDGTVLIAKSILTKVFRLPESREPSGTKYKTLMGTAFTTICPSSLRNDPTTPAPDLSHPDQITSTELKFAAETEPWNTYELGDGETLINQLKVTNVGKTTFFQADGDPIYLISWGVAGFRIDKEFKIVIPQNPSQNPPTSSQSMP
jgi:hypothetical protein